MSDRLVDVLRLPTHQDDCQCGGRGWFEDHQHQPECADDECVGCSTVREPCRWMELVAADALAEAEARIEAAHKAADDGE